MFLSSLKEVFWKKSVFCFLSRQYFKDRNFRVPNERKIFTKNIRFFWNTLHRKNFREFKIRFVFVQKKISRMAKIQEKHLFVKSHLRSLP